MSMTPLQSRAIHWTPQDMVDLSCIIFSPLCMLKKRVLGVRVPSVVAAAANARV